jgi:hypothetical protein
MFSLQRKDTCARLKVWKTACDPEGGSEFGFTTVVFLRDPAPIE